MPKTKPAHHHEDEREATTSTKALLGEIRRDLEAAGIPLGRGPRIDGGWNGVRTRNRPDSDASVFARTKDPLPAFTDAPALRTGRKTVPVYPVTVRFDPSIIRK